MKRRGSLENLDETVPEALWIKRQFCGWMWTDSPESALICCLDRYSVAMCADILLSKNTEPLISRIP